MAAKAVLGAVVVTVRPSAANATGSEALTSAPPADASSRSQAVVTRVCGTSTVTGALAMSPRLPTA